MSTRNEPGWRFHNRPRILPSEEQSPGIVQNEYPDMPWQAIAGKPGFAESLYCSMTGY